MEYVKLLVDIGFVAIAVVVFLVTVLIDHWRNRNKVNFSQLLQKAIREELQV